MIEFMCFYENIDMIGKAQYIKNEHSFYYEPWNEVEFSILIGDGYNSLDVNLKNNQILQLTGVNPQDKWIKKNITVPKARTGKLLAIFDEECKRGIGIQYATMWKTYFNVVNGWICIGNPKCTGKSEAIEFAKNTIAVISEKYLSAIWIKPDFI